MNKTVHVVYDRQCPACSKYCELVRQHAVADDVVLVDARTPSELMKQITQSGLDIDMGMVVTMDGDLHWGAEAIHQLALRDEGRSLFNRFNRALFRHARIAHVTYPLLRSVRNVLLRLLGVRKINNLNLQNNSKF